MSKIFVIYDPSCCVIMINGSRIKEDKRQALELGADNYIYKPFNIRRSAK